MPYIRKEQRPSIDAAVESLKCAIQDNVKEGISSDASINYALCRLYRELNPQTYPEMAKILSGMDMAKMEIYRRCVSRYEDAKLVQNGDVFFL